MNIDRYNQRGVSADKEDVHNAIKNADKGLFPSAFCKIVPDYLSEDEDYCLVMHADGAGTKSSLANTLFNVVGENLVPYLFKMALFISLFAWYNKDVVCEYSLFKPTA